MLITSLMAIPKSHHVRTVTLTTPSVWTEAQTVSWPCWLGIRSHPLLPCPASQAEFPSPPRPALPWVWLAEGVAVRLRNEARSQGVSFPFPVCHGDVMALSPASKTRRDSFLRVTRVPERRSHPILCIRYCFLLLAVSRFLSSYLAFLFSRHFRNQLPELNSLHLNLLLVCVLMVGYWQSFHLNIKSFPESVLLMEN